MKEPTRRQTQARTRQEPAKGVLIVSGQSTIVFLTVCTADRRPWLATPEHHAALTQIWREEATAWLVGRYVLMPDHMHLFAALAEETSKLEMWLRFWKRRFCQRQGLALRALQRGKWDTRMRTSAQYEQYVLHNPVRHGLVAQPGEWPHAGELQEIRW